MAFWINIYGCQTHSRYSPLKVKQLKSDSYHQALYHFYYTFVDQECFPKTGKTFGTLLKHDFKPTTKESTNSNCTGQQRSHLFYDDAVLEDSTMWLNR